MKEEVNKVSIIKFSEFLVHYFSFIKNETVTNLQMQKILYYIQAYHLVHFNNHPFFDDVPEAWVRGPVYRTVYNQYKSFGSGPIILTHNENSYNEALENLNVSANQQKYLHSALEFFSNQSINELIFRTHSERPWIEARKDVGLLEYGDNKISLESMFSFYKELIEKNKAQKKENDI